MLRVISLGAGVQSTTMALMAGCGEIGPMPDCAIFADTGSEPSGVYRHLEWLRGGVLPFPVYVVSRGSKLHEDLMRGTNATKQRFASIPAFLDGGTEREGIGRRQCTREYKVDVLAKKQRELLGFKPRQRIPHNSIEVWLGISLDEAVRMREARNNWQKNRWPLIEKQMSRWDCLRWLERHGYPRPPKSACTFCPYHNDTEWRRIRDEDPAGWQQALEVDAAIRGNISRYAQTLRKKSYLHRSLKPLGEVDLRTHAEIGQPDLFMNECEGMCGV